VDYSGYIDDAGCKDQRQIHSIPERSLLRTQGNISSDKEPWRVSEGRETSYKKRAMFQECTVEKGGIRRKSKGNTSYRSNQQVVKIETALGCFEEIQPRMFTPVREWRTDSLEKETPLPNLGGTKYGKGVIC
jgi:hypothetical protein